MKNILKLINAFDEAARDWGWQSDQGSGNDVPVSQQKYETAKAALIKGIERKIDRLKKKSGK